jgi:hypothetical protein
MNRRTIMRGQFHQVDCAVREDGRAPAGQFLNALKKGVWDQHEELGPLDEQISEYHWFLNAIRHWANTGEPVYRDAVKALEDGIWEFRHGDKRLTFFDTDGNGGYTAKLQIRSHADAEAPDSEYLAYPLFRLPDPHRACVYEGQPEDTHAGSFRIPGDQRGGPIP